MAFGIAFGKRVWGWSKRIIGIQSELHQTHSRLADGFKSERDQCAAQLAKCRRRAMELQDDLETRDDMSAQDRAYIRGLERLCHEAKVDTEPLKKALLDEYAQRKTWE